MSFLNKLQTIAWFLRRPTLYQQLTYLFYQRLFPHPKEDTREEATKWCQERGVSSLKAIEIFTGNTSIKPLKELFSDFFIEAEKRVKNLPVKMGGGADMELLYYLAEHWKATTIIETGVAHGWSSSVLLFSLQNRLKGLLFSTDMPYPKMNNEDFVGCVVPQVLKEKWKLIRLPDQQAFKEIYKSVQSIDMCHYDSDKSYRGRMWTYPKLWSLLRVGGLFISDDVNDNVAFKEFAESKGENPVIVYYEPEQKYIGLLIKRGDPKI